MIKYKLKKQGYFCSSAFCFCSKRFCMRLATSSPPVSSVKELGIRVGAVWLVGPFCSVRDRAHGPTHRSKIIVQFRLKSFSLQYIVHPFQIGRKRDDYLNQISHKTTTHTTTVFIQLYTQAKFHSHLIKKLQMRILIWIANLNCQHLIWLFFK